MMFKSSGAQAYVKLAEEIIVGKIMGKKSLALGRGLDHILRIAT